jgi:restriction endonuclease Mrr
MIGVLLLFGVVRGVIVVVRFIRRRLIRCRHGARGAHGNPSLCPECAMEATERQALRRAEADRQASAEARRRQKEYDEYRARIRLPRFLALMNPYEFEHLVCEVYRRRGYEVKETPKSGDEGIDGFLRSEGKLYLLQCKRVKGGVGAPVVRDLYGAMVHEGAAGGILVTTGTATESARKWALGKPIEIVELNGFCDMVRSTFRENEVVPSSFQPWVRTEPKNVQLYHRRRRYRRY